MAQTCFIRSAVIALYPYGTRINCTMLANFWEKKTPIYRGNPQQPPARDSIWHEKCGIMILTTAWGHDNHYPLTTGLDDMPTTNPSDHKARGHRSSGTQSSGTRQIPFIYHEARGYNHQWRRNQFIASPPDLPVEITWEFCSKTLSGNGWKGWI